MVPLVPGVKVRCWSPLSLGIFFSELALEFGLLLNVAKCWKRSLSFIWPHLSRDLILHFCVIEYFYIDYPEAGQAAIAGHKHQVQREYLFFCGNWAKKSLGVSAVDVLLRLRYCLKLLPIGLGQTSFLQLWEGCSQVLTQMSECFSGRTWATPCHSWAINQD